MYSIPDATSAEDVYNILKEIEKTDEPGIHGNSEFSFITVLLNSYYIFKYYLCI